MALRTEDGGGVGAPPLEAEAVARGGLRLSEPRLTATGLLLLEGRPVEEGRQLLVRVPAGGGEPEVISPPGRSVRSRVYEYGGGAWCAARGRIFAVFEDDGRVHRLHAGGAEPLPGCLPGAWYGDLVAAPDGRAVVAVEEEPQEAGQPRHRLVVLGVAGGRRVLFEGSDFVSSPALAPDGSRVAFLAWDHPAMPWDATRLLAADDPLGGHGPPRVRVLAGSSGVSRFHPCFGPGGELVYASDRSGFWNLVLHGDPPREIARERAEYGRPQWVLGMRTLAFPDARRLVCVRTRRGLDELVRIDLRTGARRGLPLPLTRIEALDARNGDLVVLGAGPEEPPALLRVDPDTGARRTLRAAFAPDELGLTGAGISRPEPVSWATGEGEQAFGFLYRPPGGGRPPVVLRPHGGPTGSCEPVLDPRVQYLTRRGIGVLDLDYRGSSGYGRAYRERLRGGWGVLDVEDTLAAARWLLGEGLARDDGLAVSGRSAGALTALLALAAGGPFRGGSSWYGVLDLESLADETHKFESHYLEGLVGPWPAARARYRERSPLRRADGIRAPVILFQGGRDRVVPPAQAEAMAAALARRSVPHALLLLPEEGHGFRRASTLRRVLEAELAFLGRCLGVETGLPLPPLRPGPEAAARRFGAG